MKLARYKGTNPKLFNKIATISKERLDVTLAQFNDQSLGDNWCNSFHEFSNDDFEEEEINYD